ncbi:putative peptide-N(4)-(N-acetyl-beta-glucosaminyl)asparagine amidase-like [Homarus americanus]|uniref:Putative peptide-N(4)-(N-acetyl-beta-glucosaminyl)asparagine amidase-like n=1 Tax=Homarus americanus TaxID=6706 RepID=A0A8J5JVJ8_HOMAM|nr:putative peptide-N(4)-(N-acetyl-beta-glucosaminyl)asparagine amidase-like [Homarus americanus]
MGFQEGEDRLVLPIDDPLDNLRQYRQQLMLLKKMQLKKSRTAVKGGLSNTVTPLFEESESEFRATLTREFERVLIYESPSLQEKAAASFASATST